MKARSVHATARIEIIHETQLKFSRHLTWTTFCWINQPRMFFIILLASRLSTSVISVLNHLRAVCHMSSRFYIILQQFFFKSKACASFQFR